MVDVKDLAGLSEPAKTLIERFSDMCGAVAHPIQVVRNAHAEAKSDIIKAHGQVEVDKIRALGDIEITDLQKRALRRFVQEEGEKQQNIEDVIEQAKPLLIEDAKPEEVDKDWATNFFDKVRLVSDKDVQILWSRILAGEANEPGTFSRRTINLLQDLDKKNAAAFLNVCRFAVNQKVKPDIHIYDETNQIYRDAGVTYSNIHELQALGLLAYSYGHYYVNLSSNDFCSDYFGTLFSVSVPESKINQFQLGIVLLTEQGRELAKLCTPEPVEGFAEYLVAKWRELGYTVEELPSAETSP